MILSNNSKYRWVILSLFVCSQLFLSMAGYGWGALAPFIKELMSLNSTKIGIVSSVFYFAVSLSAFPSGIIVDKYGVKNGLLLWLGLTGAPLASLSCSPQNYLILIIMVGIAGVGYGMGNPVASKGLFSWFDQKSRGTAFGIRLSAVSIGGALAGTILVYISSRIGPFMAIGTIGLIILCMFIIVCFLYRNPDKAGGVSSFIERKDNLSINTVFRYFFSNRALFMISIAMAMLGAAQGIIVTFFLLYVNETLGYSLLMSGSLLTVVMISGAIGRFFWGVVSDYLFNGCRKPVLVIISILATLSIVMLALWNPHWPKWLFIILISIIGISNIGWASITLVLVTEISASSKTATSVGLSSTIGWTGLYIGPIVFGIITDYLGYFYAWMFLAGICTFSLIFIYLTQPLPKRT